MNRTASLLALAAVLGAVAVALGAWAAHGLEAAYGARAVALVETAVRYQLWHALAIMAALGLHRVAGREVEALVRAAQLFALGMILFCGALYILAFGGPRWLGAVAPIGGLGMITGWLMLAWGAVKAFRNPQSRG